MNVDHLISQLQDPKLVREIRESLSVWPDVTPEEIDTAVEVLGPIQQNLVTLIRTVQDPDDVMMSLAIQYIEIKAKWIATNTRVNYTVFREGKPVTADALRGTTFSMFLMWLEDLITADDINRINDFLSQPLKVA